MLTSIALICTTAVGLATVWKQYDFDWPIFVGPSYVQLAQAELKGRIEGKLEEQIKNLREDQNETRTRALDGQLQTNDLKREFLRQERFKLEIQLKTTPRMDPQARQWIDDRMRSINEQLQATTNAQDDLLRQKAEPRK